MKPSVAATGQGDAFIGFPPLPDQDLLVGALLADPPERRWRVVRDLARIDDPEERLALKRKVRGCLDEAHDFRVEMRLNLALEILSHPCPKTDYVLVRGQGVWKRPGAGLRGCLAQEPAASVASASLFFPVVDFHVHPQLPDLVLLADLREGGVSRGVISATDTDPEDVDRPEINGRLRDIYENSPQAKQWSFQALTEALKTSLHSITQVSNQDVADWAKDYPEVLIGLGSVNLSKSRAYVEQTLEEIYGLKLRGVRLLPHAQFFNPADNDNLELLGQFCQETGAILMSHCGCGFGPFELPDFCQDAHPIHWEPFLKKFPDVDLVLAHFGAYSPQIPGLWLHEVLQLGKRYRNVYGDLAAVPWLLQDDRMVEEIRRTMGFDRVLFASNYPLPLSWGLNLAYLVSLVKTSTFLTEKEKWKVLGKNAQRLLKLS
jgi:predicted TIM-barrel fold metal-dependent hydrolase